MKKKKPVVPIIVKPKPTAKRRSCKAEYKDVLDMADPFIPAHHFYDRLLKLSPQIKKAADILLSDKEKGNFIQLPAENLLQDLLSALHDFRAISRRRAGSSLMTLATEADEIWERLHLCENINCLAANLKPWLIESPRSILLSDGRNNDFRTRLHDLLNKNVDALESDLESLISLLPEEYRKHFEILVNNTPAGEPRIVLARICADLLRERKAHFGKQFRLIAPLIKFFFALGSRNLLLKMGFFSKAKIEEARDKRRREKARERQKRHRLAKNPPHVSA